MTNPSDSDPGFFDRLAAAGSQQASESSLLEIETNELAEQTSSENDAEEITTDNKLGRGRLPPDARRALVELLRSGVVLASAKPLVYELLCRYQPLMEDHLADMYLRMLIDQPAGVVLLLQQQDQEEIGEEEESSALISRRTLSLYDTLLLLVLRKHYQERQTAGEQQVIIDVERIEAQLTPFLPLTTSSRRDRRKLSGAIIKMKERKLLASVRGDDERFEITPVIRYVVNAEFLEQMLAEYQGLVGQLLTDQDEAL